MSWRPIFVHEFLDGRLDNINGVAGEFLTSSPPPAVNRHVRLLPGAWFTYRLDRPRMDVIGLDVTYRVHAPASGAAATLPLLSVPGAFSAILRFANPLTSEIVDGDLVHHADLLVDVGGAGIAFEALRIPHRFAIELRVAWHTSGQLHLWMDGTLEAYQAGIQPGARLTLGDLSCGSVGSARELRPRWFVDRLTVRALDETDAVDSVVGDLPFEGLDDVDDSDRCRIEAIRYAHRIADQYRALMDEFIAVTTQPWQRSIEPDGTAFDDSAVRAHTAATAAFSSLMTFLREGDDTAHEAYLDRLQAFLSELHNEVPQAFAQLLDDLGHVTPPPEACLDLAATSLAGHGRTLQMLSQVADETLLVARSMVGGDDGG